MLYGGQEDYLFKQVVVRDSSVGTAIGCGLDGPGVEHRWGREFSPPCRLGLGPIQPNTKQIRDLISGGKADGALHKPPTLIQCPD